MVISKHDGTIPSNTAQTEDIAMKASSALNPASLLPLHEKEGLGHECLQTIEQVYSSCSDLKDTPLQEPDWEQFTDGSSFVVRGEWKAGYAVVTLEEEMEAKPLPLNTSAQRLN